MADFADFSQYDGDAFVQSNPNFYNNDEDPFGDAGGIRMNSQSQPDIFESNVSPSY